MLPTLTPDPHTGASTRERVVQDLDELLFTPCRWFALNADNQAVPGVRAATLDAALGLIGSGQVATVAGRLRAGVHAVDVDAEGELGDEIALALVTWCLERAVWFLVRASGGAPGRRHIYVVPGSHADALAEHCQALRQQFSRSARTIDHRGPGSGLRPLSAPHRKGGTRTPSCDGDLTEKLTQLRDVLNAPAPTKPSQPLPPGPATPARPITPRASRPLPERWHAYFATGTVPALAGQRVDCAEPSEGYCSTCELDHSRSTIEAHATQHLILTGFTADTAWSHILASDPVAMTKARSKGRSWWTRYVWDVAAAKLESGRGRRRPPNAHVTTAVAQGRRTLHQAMWALSPRQRPAFLTVGHHLLDRMARDRTLRVPAAERNLVEDTGITDRKTIRTALRALHGLVGVLHTDALTSDRESSSFEFELAPVEGESQIPPPSSHTPLPKGTWHTLPSSCHSLHRALTLTTEGLTAEQAAVAAGIVNSPTDNPTSRQLRTTRERLLQLAVAGLANCSAEGIWTPLHTPTNEHTTNATSTLTEVTRIVAEERRSYREHHTSDWHRGRARAYRLQIARERHWWTTLPAHQRQTRRRTLQRTFRDLPVHEKVRLTARLATKRTIAGESEVARHLAWQNSHTPEQYAQRSSERQDWYYSLAKPLRKAHVSAWNDHRYRFNVAPTPLEHALLPTRDMETKTPHDTAQILTAG